MINCRASICQHISRYACRIHKLVHAVTSCICSNGSVLVLLLWCVRGFWSRLFCVEVPTDDCAQYVPRIENRSIVGLVCFAFSIHPHHAFASSELRAFFACFASCCYPSSLPLLHILDFSHLPIEGHLPYLNLSFVLFAVVCSTLVLCMMLFICFEVTSRAECLEFGSRVPGIVIDVMCMDLLFEEVAPLAHAFGSLLNAAFLACVASPFDTGCTTLCEVGMVELLVNWHSYWP